MDNDRAIIELTIADEALEKANDIHEMIDLRDKFMAYNVIAAARGMSEIAQKAKIYQLKAERKAGAWLAENVKPGNPQLYQDVTIDTRLPDGIDRKESSRWQAIAKVSDEIFNAWIDDCLANNYEISRNRLLQIAKGGVPHIASRPNCSFTHSEIDLIITGLRTLSHPRVEELINKIVVCTDAQRGNL